MKASPLGLLVSATLRMYSINISSTDQTQLFAAVRAAVRLQHMVVAALGGWTNRSVGGWVGGRVGGWVGGWVGRGRF